MLRHSRQDAGTNARRPIHLPPDAMGHPLPHKPSAPAHETEFTMHTKPARRAFAFVLPMALLLAAGLQAGCQRSLLAVRQSGDAHFARAQYVEAETEYREYLDRSPARPEVHFMLGRTLLAQGRTAEAREQLLLANRLTPENDDVFKMTCEGLYSDKQYEELNRLLRSRTIDRGRMDDWLLLADYSMRQGDMDEAARSLLTAAKVDGGRSVEPQLGLAKISCRSVTTPARSSVSAWRTLLTRRTAKWRLWPRSSARSSAPRSARHRRSKCR